MADALDSDEPDVELYYQKNSGNLFVVDRTDRIVVTGGNTPGETQTIYRPTNFAGQVDDQVGGTLVRPR